MRGHQAELGGGPNRPEDFPPPAPHVTGLSPADVEYLFRAIKRDIGTIETRLRSLSRHYEGNTDLRDKIEIGVSEAMILSHTASVCERVALAKELPHRMNAGEID